MLGIEVIMSLLLRRQRCSIGNHPIAICRARPSSQCTRCAHHAVTLRGRVEPPGDALRSQAAENPTNSCVIFCTLTTNELAAIPGGKEGILRTR